MTFQELVLGVFVRGLEHDRGSRRVGGDDLLHRFHHVNLRLRVFPLGVAQDADDLGVLRFADDIEGVPLSAKLDRRLLNIGHEPAGRVHHRKVLSLGSLEILWRHTMCPDYHVYVSQALERVHPLDRIFAAEPLDLLGVVDQRAECDRPLFRTLRGFGREFDRFLDPVTEARMLGDLNLHDPMLQGRLWDNARGQYTDAFHPLQGDLSRKQDAGSHGPPPFEVAVRTRGVA